VWRGLWNSTSAYNANDVTYKGSGYNIVQYVALQANVGQDPATATTIWQQSAYANPPVGVLGAGSTNITHAAHANRPLTVNQAGATTAVFAGTATSGALDGDTVTI